MASAVAVQGRFPMSRVAEVLEVSRSQLHARTSGVSRPRGSYRKADDAELLPAIRRLVDDRPTYGYRRIAVLLNRERRSAGLEPVNRKRVLRILGKHDLTLERCTGRREGRVHDGKVAVMASNLRWCSDALEIGCWSGEKVRIAFIIDAFDREIIAHVAVAGAGVSGSDVRDMMLAAVEQRFAADRAPHAIEHLSDNGSCYTAKDTRDFATALGLVPCFTPVRSPESNGMAEAFVKTLKRDYVRVTPLPDANTVLGLVAGWITDYNTVHPHSALRMRSPAEFRAALNSSQAVR
jgi:putative transposase